MTIFAPNFERNSKGWIKFPQMDTSIRKRLFPEECIRHPAKANLYMLQAIIDYLYKPGETILDPMAGTGSIMIAALSGCKVICIDCCEAYAELMELSKASILQHKPDADILILHGDCYEYLPIPVDHVCFSPPYANILAKKRVTERDISTDAFYLTEEELVRYSSGKGNVGTMSEFFHIQRMEQIFAKLYSSLHPGGTMTFITKDHIEAGRRVYLTRKYIKAAERVGFKLREAYKWETKGSLFAVVKDEDIVIMER